MSNFRLLFHCFLYLSQYSGLTTVENKMNTSAKLFFVPAALAAVLIAGPAFADCAQDIENVKTVAQSATLSEEDKAKVDAAVVAAAEKQATGDEESCATEIIAAKMILQIE
jgi:hypothetical protein